MGFLLAYLHLTLTYSKGQGQDHAHSDSEYLGNGDKHGRNYYCHRIPSYLWAFPLEY